MLALECAAKCFFGVVADAAGHSPHPEFGGGQQIFRKVHAPLRQIPDRRSSEYLPEARVEQRAGYCHASSKLRDGPMLFGRLVQPRHR